MTWQKPQSLGAPCSLWHMEQTAMETPVPCLPVLGVGDLVVAVGAGEVAQVDVHLVRHADVALADRGCD